VRRNRPRSAPAAALPVVEPEARPAVHIDRLAAGGDGVGRMPDGRAVFVPRTAPGDRVQLTDVRYHARYARARLGRLLEPGPRRVAPRCAHYVEQDCGGCQWQHLELSAQLEAKRELVVDALRRIGGLDVPVAPTLPPTAPWGYRSRITLTPGPGRRYAGFHPCDAPDRVFPLERCEIAAPAVAELWQRARQHLALLPRDTERIVLQVDRSGARHLLVRAGGERAWTTAPALVARLDEVDITVWWQPRGGAPRIVAGDRDARPAGVFEQVAPEMGDRVRDWVLSRLGELASIHAWDLYAGIGETTAKLALLGASVESVEQDSRAVAVAESEWAARETGGYPPVRRHTGTVEDLVDRLADPAVVVANPPRAGMEARVTAALAARRPARVAYISCDPATLARDLRRLAGGTDGSPFRVTAVQPFDLFPQTAHVESVALLELIR
jgi:23S rRNA (uracil1939-C5)-methyltransferase